jgi:uncharacterized protein YegP (UPF0339 family)
MAKSAGFDYYRDKGDEWRLDLRAKNGQLLANGGEGKLAYKATCSARSRQSGRPWRRQAMPRRSRVGEGA